MVWQAPWLVMTSVCFHSQIYGMNNALEIICPSMMLLTLVLLQHRSCCTIDRSVHTPKTGASIPLSQWCKLRIPLYLKKIINFPCFRKNYKFPRFFLLNLGFFASPLFWPRCIYASCRFVLNTYWMPCLSKRLGRFKWSREIWPPKPMFTVDDVWGRTMWNF